MTKRWVAAAVLVPIPVIGAVWLWSTYRAVLRVSISDTAKKLGLSNLPSLRLWLKARRLDKIATAVIATLRETYPKATLSSAIRTPAVNAAVGGVGNSNHMKAEALDLAGFPPSPEAVAIVRSRLAELGYPHAEIIVEKDHLHAEGLA